MTYSSRIYWGSRGELPLPPFVLTRINIEENKMLIIDKKWIHSMIGYIFIYVSNRKDPTSLKILEILREYEKRGMPTSTECATQ